jgi:hypothetical protein
LFVAEFDGASMTYDVDEQPRRFEIGISGGVDERQTKLSAAFPNFPRNVGCDQQRRWAQGFALSLEHSRDLESVDCFYFGAKGVLATIRSDL